MKVKFIGATPEEDHIVEVPEGTGTLEIPYPVLQKSESMWPVCAVLITICVCVTAVIWMLTRG